MSTCTHSSRILQNLEVVSALLELARKTVITITVVVVVYMLLFRTHDLTNSFLDTVTVMRSGGVGELSILGVAIKIGNTERAAILADDINARLQEIGESPEGSSQQVASLRKLTSELSAILTQFDKDAKSIVKSQPARAAGSIAADTVADDSGQTLPAISEGYIFLGRVNGGTWAIESSQTVVADSRVPEPGELVTTRMSVYLRSEPTAGRPFSSATPIGVIPDAQTFRILQLRRTPAPEGGEYLWAKVRPTDSLSPR